MNVPGLSERTLEREIVRSGFSTGAEVQVSYSTVCFVEGLRCLIVAFLTYMYIRT